MNDQQIDLLTLIENLYFHAEPYTSGEYQNSKMKSAPYRPNGAIFSQHARQRMTQRNISESDVNYILRHGRRLLHNDVIFVFLCPGEFPKHKRAQKKFANLDGVAVLVALYKPVVITVYRGWWKWRKLIYRPTSARDALPLV